MHPFEKYRDIGTFIFQADEYCQDCGMEICESLDQDRKRPKDPTNQHSYDSDHYPKPVSIHEVGPRDYWAYCGSCGELLPGGLTEYAAKNEVSHILSKQYSQVFISCLSVMQFEKLVEKVQSNSDPEEAKETVIDQIEIWEADGII